MSDDLSKVVFGDPIEMTGKRPAWLEYGIPMRWSAGGNPYLDVKSHECVNWGRDYPVSIRLPVDHPYYRQTAEPKGLTTNETLPSDPIAKRMEALVRRIADDEHFSDSAEARAVTREARAIVALLPEPVDADLVEAREMAIDLMSKTVIANGNPQAAPEIVRIREGKGDTNSYVVACLAAIRRGRALERDSREG